MLTIEFTENRATVQGRPMVRMLTRAAMAAGTAPSIYISQPWYSRIADDTAELRADRERLPRATDSAGRLLTIRLLTTNVSTARVLIRDLTGGMGYPVFALLLRRSGDRVPFDRVPSDGVPFDGVPFDGVPSDGVRLDCGPARSGPGEG